MHLRERYAEFGQVGFVGFDRMGGTGQVHFRLKNLHPNPKAMLRVSGLGRPLATPRSRSEETTEAPSGSDLGARWQLSGHVRKFVWALAAWARTSLRW